MLKQVAEQAQKYKSKDKLESVITKIGSKFARQLWGGDENKKVKETQDLTNSEKQANGKFYDLLEKMYIYKMETGMEVRDVKDMN